MREIWRMTLLAAVSVTLMFAAAARICKLDPVTMRMPHFVRSMVATLAVHENTIGPNALNRALTIDPQNTAAWSRRCTAYVGKDAAERLNDCQHAVSLRDSAANLRGEASAQEETGDVCAAEGTYRAALKTLKVQRPYVMRDQARAALACGDVGGSLAALREAESADTATPENLAVDHGYMAVVYDRMDQPEKARQMCSEANPGYGNCTCELTGSGLNCSQKIASAK